MDEYQLPEPRFSEEFRSPCYGCLYLEIVKGSEDDHHHSELRGFWILFLVQY
jgi:hypothetical protein